MKWTSCLGSAFLLSVVQVVALHAQPTLKLSAPTLVFEDTDGELTLTRAEGRIVVDPRQTVWLYERGQSVVRAVSASGSRRMGAKGSGPGEYRSVNTLGWLGDSIWVADAATDRISFHHAESQRLVGTLPFLGAAAGTFGLLPDALTPDGRAITRQGVDARRIFSGETKRLSMFRSTRDGQRSVDTLATFSVQNSVLLVAPAANSMVMMTQPFSDADRVGFSAGGTFAAIAQVGSQAGALGTPAYLDVRSTTGRPVYRKPLPAILFEKSGPSMSTIADRWIDTVLALREQKKNMPVSRSQLREALYVPTRRSPVTEIIVGDDGSVLLRGNDWVPGPVRYAWLRPDGSVRGSFTVPAMQTIRAFRGDQIWSLVEDEDGAVRVVRQTVSG